MGEKAPGPWWAGPQALGARPQAPWRPGPQAPGAWIPPRRVFNFLLRLKPISPGLKTLGCYHNPQSADLGGRWMVSEGYSPMRGGVPVFTGQARGSGDLANKPLSPASRQPSRVTRCSSAHGKPGLLHRLISCAQSLQPSLTFLLRRNNKVQGARS